MTEALQDDPCVNTTSILTKLKHETLLLAALKLPPHMPKKVGDKAVQSLMRAMHRTGQQLVPVVIDDDGVIVDGFEIAMALRELGATEVGVVRLSNLTAAETKAIMLLLAKIPEQSSWDEDAIAILMEEISIDDSDALDITGFDVAEIDIALSKSINGSGKMPERENAEDEKLESALSGDQPPIVCAGDLFHLGLHQILCSNSLDRLSYDILMEGYDGSVVITDPPYNIAIAGNVSGLGKTKHADFAMGVGEMSRDQFDQFLQQILKLVSLTLRNGALLFVFMDRRHLEELLHAVRETGLRLVDVAIWNKLSGGMGGLYRSQHEPCVVAQAGDGPLQNNVQLGKFGRYRTNVWDFRGYSSFGKDRAEALAAHPTVKPWPMLAEIVLDCTKRGEVVVDPFLGSGSTLLAAEKTGRLCYGIELEPKYVEVAIARWEAMTGKKAIHASSGLTLDQLREKRRAISPLQIAASDANGGTTHE